MVMLEAGDILIRRGLIDQEQLDQLRRGGGSASSLVDAAIQQGMVGEESALRALGEELGMEFVDLRNAEVDIELVKSFPQKLIYRHSLFPLSRQNGSLTLATSDPLDVYALDEAGSATGLTIIPVVAERGEIARLMKKHLGVGSETVEGLLAARADDDEVQLLEELEVDGSELGEMAQEASVVRLNHRGQTLSIDLVVAAPPYQSVQSRVRVGGNEFASVHEPLSVPFEPFRLFLRRLRVLLFRHQALARDCW